MQKVPVPGLGGHRDGGKPLEGTAVLCAAGSELPGSAARGRGALQMQQHESASSRARPPAAHAAAQPGPVHCHRAAFGPSFAGFAATEVNSSPSHRPECCMAIRACPAAPACILLFPLPAPVPTPAFPVPRGHTAKLSSGESPRVHTNPVHVLPAQAAGCLPALHRLGSHCWQ